MIMKGIRRIERRIQISGSLVIAGMLVELLTLYWSHATAFLLFLTIGGALILGGIVLYLISLVTRDMSL